MSAKKFKFVSPGVFLNEIDNSILPKEPREIGPLLMGRARRGPAMRPVTIDSFEQFVNLYGEPVPGGDGEDIWRNGNKLTPMYGTYAAQAWLKNSSTLTFFRLAGVEHLDKNTSSDIASAGWKTSYFLSQTADASGPFSGSVTDGVYSSAPTSNAAATLASSGGAFGLWVFPQKIKIAAGAADAAKNTTGSLAAVWYVDEGSVGLKGKSTFTNGTAKDFAQAEPIATDSFGNFTLVITSSNSKEEIMFNFDPNNKKFLRKVFNTNPTLVNSEVTPAASLKKYWLGETFENTIKSFNVISSSCGENIETVDNVYWGVIAYLGQVLTGSSTKDHAKQKKAFTNPETGWYFTQDTGASGSFDPRNKQKLFKFIAHGHGEWAQNNLKISIQNIKAPSNNFNSYPTFDVVVRSIADSDKSQVILEKFSNCNLDRKSPDFIGAKIGTQYYEFNSSSRRLILKGEFTNKSKYIYVKLSDALDQAILESTDFVPFGVYGPTTYRDFSIQSDNTSGDQTLKAVLTSSANPAEETVDSSTGKQRVWGVLGKATNYRGLENFTKLCSRKNLIITTGAAANDKGFTISFPAGTQGSGSATPVKVIFKTPMPAGNPAVDEVYVYVDVSDTAARNNLVAAINGQTQVDTSKVKFGTSVGNAASGIFGISGGNGVLPNSVSVYADAETSAAADITFTDNVGSALLAVSPSKLDETSYQSLFVTSSQLALDYKFLFPKIQLRKNTAQDGLSSASQANFGVWTGESETSTVFNKEIIDLVRPKSSDVANAIDPEATDILDYQFIFTLDDVYYDDTNKRYAYESGKRRSGLSVTAKNAGTWKDLINTGICSFTTVMYGGTDGWDITEKDPLRNTFLDDGNNSETANYAFNSVKQAIDSVKDPEFAEYNLVAIPGVTNQSLTRHLIDTMEARADALAVIDLKGDYQPSHESTAASYGTVAETVSNLKDRAINSSYACAYYPYVQVRDTLSGDLIYMPPSVLAIGAMSYTDKIKAPWFSPAGFNRGGLSSGIAGLPVVGITDKLTSQDRDNLYDANINPIASFPSEGIVIFGQKTLQVTRSALDRINVRRLLLYVKKGVSRIANELLFEPNVQETWDRFLSRANPFLADVKARFGLTDYKLVLDKTTTTPDLIDQNVMYAKVFLKPARAIEFIAVDFVITNTGASFED